MCAFQDGFTSDNPGVPLVRIRRLFGGLAWIQKANEWYQNHKPLVIVVHGIVIVMIAILLFRALA